MNGPSPRFWVLLKRAMLILAALSLVAAVVLYFTLDGLSKTFFALCAVIIAVNFLFIYSFVRINDKKRPGPRDFEVRIHEKERYRTSDTEHFTSR